MKFTNTVDIQQNNVINILIDPRATAPANGKQGQFYFNTTNNVFYKHNGTEWVSVTSVINITSENQSIIIDNTNGVFDLGVNVDNATLEINNTTGVTRIKDSGVTTNKLADNAVTNIKIVDKAVTFAKIQDIPTMTVIGRVTAGSGPASAISIINTNDMSGASDTNLATAGSTKAYIDSLIAGIGSLIGSFDANTSTTFPGTSTTKKGDYWYVTVAGTVNGVVLNVGDVLVANKVNPSTTSPNDWIFLETNRDQATTTVLGLIMLATNAEVQAGTNNTKAITAAGLSSRTSTETRTGLARIATTAEAVAGTDNTTIMTPAKVKALLDANVGGYTALIGNASALSYVITHNLNTEFVQAMFFLESTKEQIIVDWKRTSATTITVEFSVAPATNSIRVIIKK